MLLKQQGRVILKSHSLWRRLFRYCFFLIIFNGLFPDSNSLNAAVGVEMPLYQLHHQVMGQSSPAWLNSYQGLLNFLILGLVAININKLYLESDEELAENDDADPEADSISKFSVVTCQLEPSSDRSSDRFYAQRWVVKSAAGGKEAGTQTNPDPTTGEKSIQYEDSQGRSTKNSLGWASGATGGSDGDGDKPPEDGFGKEKFSVDPPIFPPKDDDEEEEEKLSTNLTDRILYEGSDNEASSTASQNVDMGILNRLDKLQSLRSQQTRNLSTMGAEIKKLETELIREIANVNMRLQQCISYEERIKALETQTSTTNQETAQIAQAVINAESNFTMNTQLININSRSINDFRTRLEDAEQRTNALKNSLQTLVNRPQATGVTQQQFNELQDQVAALQIQVTNDQQVRSRNHAVPETDQLRARVTFLEDEQRRMQTEVNSFFFTQQFSGTLIFPIVDFQKQRQEAIKGERTSIYSDPFWTSPQGYKLCVRIYLNGDGIGKGQYISMFIVVMKGKNDDWLNWPFQRKITMVAFNQESEEHVIDSFYSDRNSDSFEQPRKNMNTGSGSPMFFSLRLLDTPGYVKDDIMYFGVFVERRE